MSIPFEPAVEVVRISPEQLEDGAVVRPAAALLQELVAGGAALGWLEPPSDEEVAALLHDVTADSLLGDACLLAAYQASDLVGLGYWRRYARPTHRPHADVERLAVSPGSQGCGVGRRLMAELIAAASESSVEVLTLDLRADNARAIALYESMGFHQYGRLERFVAVGANRFDKLFYALDLRIHLAG